MGRVAVTSPVGLEAMGQHEQLSGVTPEARAYVSNQLAYQEMAIPSELQSDKYYDASDVGDSDFDTNLEREHQALMAVSEMATTKPAATRSPSATTRRRVQFRRTCPICDRETCPAVKAMRGTCCPGFRNVCLGKLMPS